MDYPQLRTYIIEQEKRGISRALIKESLITRGGWREDIVMATFNSIDTAKTIPGVLSSPNANIVSNIPAQPTQNFSPQISSVNTQISSKPDSTLGMSTPVSRSQPSGISDTMSPVQAQNKLSMLDTLYAARTGTTQTSATMPAISSTIVQQPQSVSSIQMSMSSQQPAAQTASFAGMPIDSEHIIVPTPKRNIKKIIFIIIGIVIFVGLLLAGWYAYGYFIKPKAISIVSRSLPALLAEETIPYEITSEVSGIRDIALGINDGKQTLTVSGVYSPRTKVAYGDLYFDNQDNISYGTRILVDPNSITLGALADTDKKTIEVEKEVGITLKRTEIDALRTLAEQTHLPESTPTWQALDAFFAVYAKNASNFSALAPYAKVLPDVTENGIRMRHLFIGADEINAIPETTRKNLLSSVRGTVKEIEIFTTWYPEKIKKVKLTLIDKDETGIWSQFTVTAKVVPLSEKFAKPFVFGKIVTLGSFVEQKKIQEIKENREAFLQAVFAQVELYKSSKKSIKGFCTSKTGLPDLTVAGSPFTPDNVFCKDTVDGLSITLPDQVADGKYVCRDLVNPALVQMETKPLLALCK